MSKKATEELPVEIDDLSLSLAGWQVEDFRARLVSESYWDGGYEHRVVVSATLRFLSEDWTERFAYEDDVPLPLITLARAGHPDSKSFMTIDHVDLETASKRPVRVSMRSDEWWSKKRYGAGEVQVGITAYDLQAVDLDYSGLDMPPKKIIELPVDLVDETTAGSIRPDLAVAAAYVRRKKKDDDGGDDIRVRLEGLFQLASSDELLTDFAKKSPRNERKVRDKDEYPIEIDLPNLEIEVLDETGFLLGKKEINFFGQARIAEPGTSPGRHPRWHAYVGELLDDYPGEPSRVLVRFVDGDE